MFLYVLFRFMMIINYIVYMFFNYEIRFSLGSYLVFFSLHSNLVFL
jgi:hypothetical protein